jgi:uncharacterized protein YjdB
MLGSFWGFGQLNNPVFTTNIPASTNSTIPPMQISNLATGGNIGTAANTVDKFSHFIVTQSTAGQVVTLPPPTNPVGSRWVMVENNGTSTAIFSLYNTTMNINQSHLLRWDGTNWGNAIGSNTIPVTSVSVSPTSGSLVAAFPTQPTLQLTQTVLPANATNPSVTWSSNNTNVATVNASGLVTANAGGSCTITVTTVQGGFTANCSITVTGSTVRVLPNPNLGSYSQILLQSLYDGQPAFIAPDAVPAAVTNAANALNTSAYKVYLGQNQWWYTNTATGITAGSWALFGGNKTTFGANITTNGIFTFK